MKNLFSVLLLLFCFVPALVFGQTSGVANKNLEKLVITGGNLQVSTGAGIGGIQELGITEIIGINEQVSATQYSASETIALAGTGEIVKVCLYATEDGTGAIFTPTGDLLIFKTDPAIASDDVTITAAERITIVAMMSFKAADWQSDTNGASNCQATVEVYSTATLFIAWYSATGETQWNSAAGDDEQLEINLWYRRDS